MVSRSEVILQDCLWSALVQGALVAPPSCAHDAVPIIPSCIRYASVDLYCYLHELRLQIAVIYVAIQCTQPNFLVCLLHDCNHNCALSDYGRADKSVACSKGNNCSHCFHWICMSLFTEAEPSVVQPGTRLSDGCWLIVADGIEYHFSRLHMRI